MPILIARITVQVPPFVPESLSEPTELIMLSISTASFILEVIFPYPHHDV
ncbi:hypothetical protein VIA_003918 [Vibrio orientalis CIP 102891 = ATCC 33934]|uniref:Uncharacterized protein n=1 Tax=Vibrio orientalis CIP 102891 = ATCC 33934 TaxID=675816 RepID=A0ABM9Z1I5_VIBOR|nr:hypothetical protein VIA_003918 [Vibrio orientalis CIP 102891 = ATCC 33934]